MDEADSVLLKLKQASDDSLPLTPPTAESTLLEGTALLTPSLVGDLRSPPTPGKASATSVCPWDKGWGWGTLSSGLLFFPQTPARPP